MVDVEVAIENRGPLRVHEVRLALSDYEWSAIQADAREIGVSVDALLSLVVAFAARANTNHASALALADILQYQRPK